jgi:hypothetical protein
MKPSWGNILRMFGVLLLLFAVLLDVPRRTPSFDTYFIILVAVAGFVLIILGAIFIKRKF